MLLVLLWLLIAAPAWSEEPDTTEAIRVPLPGVAAELRAGMTVDDIGKTLAPLVLAPLFENDSLAEYEVEIETPDLLYTLSLATEGGQLVGISITEPQNRWLDEWFGGLLEQVPDSSQDSVAVYGTGHEVVSWTIPDITYRMETMDRLQLGSPIRTYQIEFTTIE